jgi:hypothetical protein
MYSHSGPIKRIDSRGKVYYEVDTSKVNSGSPGFLDLQEKTKQEASREFKNYPVCLVHTQSTDENLNAGEKFNEESDKFMSDLRNDIHKRS